MSSHCPRQRTHLACKARSSISRKAVPVLGHSIFAGRSACFGGTLVRCQHRTQRSIFSHLALLARERRFLFLSKLIILFAIFNLIFPSVSELEKVQLSPRGCKTPSRGSYRLWCRYRGRDRTRCSAPHLPRSGSAFRSFRRSRC